LRAPDANGGNPVQEADANLVSALTDNSAAWPAVSALPRDGGKRAIIGHDLNRQAGV
jgi:hypothetical protein